MDAFGFGSRRAAPGWRYQKIGVAPQSVARSTKKKNAPRGAFFCVANASVMPGKWHQFAQRGRRVRPFRIGQIGVVGIVQREHLAGLLGLR